MATTTLADIEFDEDVYASYSQENRTDKNAFVQSGAIVTNQELQDRVDGQGDITSLPFWKDLNTENENISSDDPDVDAVPEKIETGKMVARRVHLNNAWSTANLVSNVMGSEDPMRQIASRTNEYWNTRFSIRALQTLLGVYLANEAGNGDMTFDVSTEDGNAATATNRWSYDGFVDAVATTGENDEAIALLCVHPDTMTQMRKENQIEFIQDSETGLMIPYYNGKMVVRDKRMPVIAGSTSGVKYLSALLGYGSMGYAEGTPKKPVAIDEKPLAGRGAGVEHLIERKQWILHPAGYRWTEASVAEDAGPTVAEVADPANWERAFKRENVNMAFFIHN